MQALAPDLASELQGRCPECGATVAVRFEPRRYCLTELRDRARFLFADVDALAQRYHWSEQRHPRHAARAAGALRRAGAPGGGGLT